MENVPLHAAGAAPCDVPAERVSPEAFRLPPRRRPRRRLFQL